MLLKVCGFGEDVKLYREHTGLSRASAAPIIGAAPETIQRWERCADVAQTKKKRSVFRVQKAFVLTFTVKYKEAFHTEPAFVIIGGK